MTDGMKLFLVFFIWAGPWLITFNILVASFVGWMLLGGDRKRLRRAIGNGKVPGAMLLEHLLTGNMRGLVDLVVVVGLAIGVVLATMLELGLVLALC